MKWELVLERVSKNRLNPETTRRKLRNIAAVAERNKSLGFKSRLSKLGDPVEMFDPKGGERIYRYLVKLRVEKTSLRSVEAAKNHFERVLEMLQKKAAAENWSVIPEGERGKGDSPEKELSRPPFHPPSLTDEVMKSVFDGIYERDAHIRLIHDSVLAYADSRRRNNDNPTVEICRSHTLLKGKPAGCKTTLFERFKTWYESEGEIERVLFVDGPTMSKAGLENFLLERAADGTLPEIIVLEEIEKQDPNNLLTLISVMGSGHVSKLNARIGHRREIANVLVWATCNDEKIIREFRNGVLWSRFAHKLHCVRPSKELMERILRDRVIQLGGNQAWVDKVMEFAYEMVPQYNGGIPIDDPREIKGLLDGKDRLLDGSYQLDKLKVIRAEAMEAAADAQQML